MNIIFELYILESEPHGLVYNKKERMFFYADAKKRAIMDIRVLSEANIALNKPEVLYNLGTDTPRAITHNERTGYV